MLGFAHRCRFRRGAGTLAAWLLAASLLGCGGGGGGGGGAPSGASQGTPPTRQGEQLTEAGMNLSTAERPQNQAEAYRFLRQATFGPTPASAAELMGMSYGEWIDAQLALPAGPSHLAVVQAFIKADGPLGNHPDHFTRSWWGQALYSPAQLRHRVAFTLSEIFVVSNRQVATDVAAAYLDMLTQMADARYRDLLEAISLHPAMGLYLSSLFNVKEDANTGQMPDENYAREVMQLFSIGLHDLGEDGLPLLDAQGRPKETFGIDDVRGLAKVFTGWSWMRPDWVPESIPWWDCVWRGPTCYDPMQSWLPMGPYPWFHSTSVKQFLGVSIATQAAADPRASLKVAMDRLASHPNTAPFISRQLIQKLVTSNPSPAYVRDVVGVWRRTDGHLGQVIKAILLHPEARHPERANVTAQHYGKINEPVLRMTHLMRALGFTSDRYQQRLQDGLIPYTDAAPSDSLDQSLGQTPMQALSVFNFYRPTFSPSGSQAARAGLLAPEMQLATETTNQSWPNLFQTVALYGWGWGNDIQHRADLQPNWRPWLSDARDAAQLVDKLAMQVLGRPVHATTKAIMVRGLEALPASTIAERLDRIRAAAVMLAVSPDVIAQR